VDGGSAAAERVVWAVVRVRSKVRGRSVEVCILTGWWYLIGT
jgi:hypothetical protein